MNTLKILFGSKNFWKKFASPSLMCLKTTFMKLKFDEVKSRVFLPMFNWMWESNFADNLIYC